MAHVFILPGIGGSTLRDPDTGRKWGFRALTRAIIDPQPLAFTHPWEPTGLLNDAVYIKHLWQLPQATRLFRSLACDLDTRVGRPAWPDPSVAVDRSAQMVVVPYDFRQSNRDSAAWLDQVVRAWSNEDEQVVVVAHSMGGVVASGWFAANEGLRRCRRLVTVGTPHRGAPKALEWLSPSSPGPIRRQSVVEVFHTWPSMYELLPRYRMIRDGENGWLRPAELTGPKEPFAGFSTKAVKGRSFHADLDQAWLDLPEEARGRLLCLLGTMHATASCATLDSDGLTLGSTGLPPDVPASQAGGDGTVPQVSATPVEVDNAPLAARGVRHRPLWHSQTTIDAIVGAFVERLSPVRGSTENCQPVLDLQVPSQVRAGDRVRVCVQVQADAAPAPGDVMRLETGAEPGTVDAVTPLERVDETTFAAEVAFDSPGVVSLTAALAHEGGRLTDRLDIAVLDPKDW
jgi:pimeloyl-ACP methyl ester carboxylesterase